MEAAKIKRTERPSAATKPASTARFKLPRKMCAIALPTSSGCLVRRRAASPFVTGSVSRYSMSEKKISAQATAPAVQRHAIAANVSEGRRNAARKPSSVGETLGMALLDDDVEKLARDKDLLHDLFAGDSGLDFIVGQRALDDEILGSVGGYNDASAEFAVDLHRNFKFFFFGERRVVLRPGSFEQVAFFAEHLPEFVG